jgi:dTDP-glucose 4,6-dehydratase
MKQKILLTGGAGFLGQNFVKKSMYDKYPYDIASIDRITNSSAYNSLYTNKNHQFYIGDILDEHFLDIIFDIERPAIVVHMAAMTSIEQSDKFLMNNIIGTQNVLNVSKKYDVKKFIYISCDSVYGNTEQEGLCLLKEGDGSFPTNLYAISKLSGEMLVKTSGLKYNILRASNIYGRRQAINKFIPQIIKSVLNNVNIPIYGDGRFIRDWLHVDDFSSVLMRIIDGDKNNEIYNVSANQEFSNLEVAQLVCNIMEKGHGLIKHIDDPIGVGHDFRYGINCDKIKKDFNWEAKHKLKSGLLDVVKWNVDNRFLLR